MKVNINNLESLVGVKGVDLDGNTTQIVDIFKNNIIIHVFIDKKNLSWHCEEVNIVSGRLGFINSVLKSYGFDIELYTLKQITSLDKLEETRK